MLGFAPISTRPISALPAVTGPATQYGSTDPSSTTTRTNLVTNPSMEVDLTGWGSAQPTERIQGVHRWANHAMVSYCTNADTHISSYTATATQTGQHIISVYFWAQAALAGKTITLSVEAGTAGVTAGASSPATLVSGGWARASLVITVNTTGTVLFVARLSQAPNLTSGEPIVTDGGLMETGAVLLPYFDGSQIDGISPDSIVWNGTPWASTSTVTYKNSGMVHYNTYTAAAAIPRTVAATGVTVSPTPAAVPTAMTKTQTATGTTVTPTTAASGTVTRFGTAPAVTVAPVTAAALGAKTSTATALCDITPYSGTNLFPNTSVETDLTDWSANTWGSISRVTTDAHDGTASALNTGAIFGTYGTTFATGQYMTAGRSYRATVWYKYLSGSNASWRMNSTVGGNSPDFGVATGAWQQGTYELDNASTTQSQNDIQMRHGSNANVGSTFLADDFHLYDITRVIEISASSVAVKSATADVTITPTTAAAGAIVITADALPTLVDIVTDHEHVANGTFETDTSGWAAYNSETLTRDTTQQHSGAASMHVVNTTFGGIANQPSYRFTMLDRGVLDISAWVKADQVTSTDFITLQVTQVGGNGLGSRQATSFPGEGSWSEFGTGWFNMTFHIPNFAFADTLVFDVQLSATTSNNGDSFWVDDFSAIERVFPLEGGIYLSALAARTALATTSVTVSPTTAAAGDVTAGAVTVTGDDALTITPTTAAAGQTDHLSTVTDPTVTPTTTVAAVTTHLATATAVTITPTTSVVPLPITDQATADITITPVPTATPAALTKTQAATALTVSPVGTSVPSAVLKSSDAATTDTPVPAATAAPITKTASADSQVGGSASGGGSPTVRPASWTPSGTWVTPPPNPSPTWSTPVYGLIETFDTVYVDMAFDTTVIPADATITSWTASIRLNGDHLDESGAGTYTWTLFEGTSTTRNGGSNSDNNPFNCTTTVTPSSWRSSSLNYRIQIHNDDFDFREGIYLSEPKIDVVYTTVGSGIVTTATLGPKSIGGDAAVTVSPATAATGVSTGSGTGTAFLTISPVTTADAAGISRSQAATDTAVAPAVAAAGTAVKAQTSTGVTVAPTPVASATVTKPATALATAVSLTTAADPLPITDTATASVTISPVTAATAAPIVDTATADTTVSPTSAATPAAMTKTATAAITVTPTTFTTSSTAGQDAVTISPVSAASGSVTRMGVANVTVTPTPSTAVPLREAMAALAFTVSLVTSTTGRYTAMGHADAVITALSDAQGIYEALGHADTTVSPVPFAKVGADWFGTAAVVIAASTHVDGRVRRPERWGTLRI